MERGTAGRRPTSPLLKFDLTVQQRFGVSVGRLVFAVTCCYYQADDCNHNHKHLIVAHEHHLPISTFEESERNTPRYPIMNIWEVKPSTVSRQCHLHYGIGCIAYQEFRLSVSSTLSTDATVATNATDGTLATTSTNWPQIQPSSHHSQCLPPHHTHQAHHCYKTLTISKRKLQNSAFWYV